MGKFNSTSKSTVSKTKSKDGVSAFKPSAYQELCDRVLTSFFGEDRFYETGEQSSKAIVSLIHKVAKKDPIFVAKLAILAREKFNLRSVTQVLVAELAKVSKGESFVSETIAQICKRPDDMTEILAYLINSTKATTDLTGRTLHNNKAIPNQVKKGIAKAFGKFNEYQLSKYNSSKKDVKLLDILRLTHPKPKDTEQSELWGRLVSGTLAPAETWERKISAAGQGDKTASEVEDTKTQEWENLILGKKLPYMAALRNLRNVVQSKVSPAAHSMLQDYICNETAVANGKQFPFRYWSAFNALEQATGLDPFIVKNYKKAIGKALYHSGKNVPQLKGRTLIAVDLSGSMTWTPLSKDSTMKCSDVAAVMGVLANQFCEDAVVMGFATEMATIPLSDDPNNVIGDIQTVRNTNLGGGTNVGQIFGHLTRNKIAVDNVLVFTDSQFNGQYNRGWGSDQNMTMDDYRKKMNPDAMLYEMNLAGFGSTQIDPRNKRNVFMSGWSDATLKYITEYQDLKTGIVDMVKKVQLK